METSWRTCSGLVGFRVNESGKSARSDQVRFIAGRRLDVSPDLELSAVFIFVSYDCFQNILLCSTRMHQA
jgi:hypothetical protein